ncbi:hypothetical protein BDV34DRAFT_191340 [Aspergillus parasiticus]|uniref:Uncharacterized protein n=1 Tax=Aspergillus parasiticus TaxID=5067 RepID=A0A5N6DRW7_ASPPA|nr:hypothetical protein BDV34DRAFT_191340 [Aspergillus parasiticus]
MINRRKFVSRSWSGEAGNSVIAREENVHRNEDFEEVVSVEIFKNTESYNERCRCCLLIFVLINVVIGYNLGKVSRLPRVSGAKQR